MNKPIFCFDWDIEGVELDRFFRVVVAVTKGRVPATRDDPSEGAYGHIKEVYEVLDLEEEEDFVERAASVGDVLQALKLSEAQFDDLLQEEINKEWDEWFDANEQDEERWRNLESSYWPRGGKHR